MSEVRGRDATKAWYELVTIDLLFNVASYTFLHPFVACIIPLSLKALRYPNEDPVLLGSMAWAMFLILVALARSFDKKWAYGNPRRVDFGEEVIVITGGAGGLGLIIAQIYGMRGANVAVLDVKAPNEEDMRGFTYYQCDIRDKNAIAAAAKKIEQDVWSIRRMLDQITSLMATSWERLRFSSTMRELCKESPCWSSPTRKSRSSFSRIEVMGVYADCVAGPSKSIFYPNSIPSSSSSPECSDRELEPS